MNSSIERLEARLVTDIDRGIVMVTHAIQQVLLRVDDVKRLQSSLFN